MLCKCSNQHIMRLGSAKSQRIVKHVVIIFWGHSMSRWSGASVNLQRSCLVSWLRFLFMFFVCDRKFVPSAVAWNLNVELTLKRCASRLGLR